MNSRNHMPYRCVFAIIGNTLCLMSIFGAKKKSNVISGVHSCSAYDKRHGKSHIFLAIHLKHCDFQ